MNPVISKNKFFLKTVNGFRLLTIVTKNSVLDAVGILALPLHSGQKVFTLPLFKNFLLSQFLTYLMLALLKPEYLLLTDNKQSLYFDDWIKKF